MFPISNRIRISTFFPLAVVLALASCGENDDPAAPDAVRDPVEIGKGQIVVSVAPAEIPAAWTLVQPDRSVRTGIGQAILEDLDPGTYALSWSDIDGYLAPERTDLDVTAGESLIAFGSYLATGDYLRLPPYPVAVPATFTMGSTVEPDETPHEVTLTRPFYLANAEVTRGQFVEALQWAYDQDLVWVQNVFVYDNLDGSSQYLVPLGLHYTFIEFDAGVFTTVDTGLPMAGMTWYGAAAYCDWLSLRTGLPRAYDHADWSCGGGDPYGATGFRLPTEAEWEMACRAGTTTHFSTGDCLDANTEANFDGRFPYPACTEGPNLGSTTVAGTYLPNPWGLYDMHGNLFEWCNDWYGDFGGDETDPVGPTAGTYKIQRGGNYQFTDGACRSAARKYYTGPRISSNQQGMRVARSAQAAVSGVPE